MLGMKKNRIHPRIRAVTRVDWRVCGDAMHIVSNLGDVSAGGLFVATSFGAPVGAAIEMHLLTDAGAIPARGHVAWSDRRGMGVRFDL
jgi:hypothetical protein